MLVYHANWPIPSVTILGSAIFLLQECKEHVTVCAARLLGV